jgi:hypothetical protein
MILHKTDCNGHFTHREQYIDSINKAYAENFEGLSQYKHEENFRRVLQKLCLGDVHQAIRRAKDIMQNNENNGYILRYCNKYAYYRENPSLSIHEAIERILLECGAASA